MDIDTKRLIRLLEWKDNDILALKEQIKELERKNTRLELKNEHLENIINSYSCVMI